MTESEGIPTLWWLSGCWKLCISFETSNWTLSSRQIQCCINKSRHTEMNFTLPTSLNTNTRVLSRFFEWSKRLQCNKFKEFLAHKLLRVPFHCLKPTKIKSLDYRWTIGFWISDSGLLWHAGLPAVSIMWGAWMTGMAADNKATLSRFEKMGMGAIRPQEGLEALNHIMFQNNAVGNVITLDSIHPSVSKPVFSVSLMHILYTSQGIAGWILFCRISSFLRHMASRKCSTVWHQLTFINDVASFDFARLKSCRIRLIFFCCRLSTIHSLGARCSGLVRRYP